MLQSYIWYQEELTVQPLNKKSPLTDKPLRNPGQSLDEEINNLYQNDVTTYLMWASVAVVYGTITGNHMNTCSFV